MIIKEELIKIIEGAYDIITRIDEVDDTIDEIIASNLEIISKVIAGDCIEYDEEDTYENSTIYVQLTNLIFHHIENQEVEENYKEYLIIILMILLKYPEIADDKIVLSEELHVDDVSCNSLLNSYSMDQEKIGLLYIQNKCSNGEDNILKIESCIIFVNKNNEDDNLMKFCNKILSLSVADFALIIMKCFERPDILNNNKLLFIHNIIDYESAESLFLLSNLSLNNISSPIDKYERPDFVLNCIKEAINSSDKSKKYRQYSNLFKVLNDYNSISGYLDKYLKIYHIFEELMVRINIVKLMRNSDYSIRDVAFIDKKSDEKADLQRLISEILQQPKIIDNLNNYFKNKPDVLKQLYLVIKDDNEDTYQKFIPLIDDSNRNKFQIDDKNKAKFSTIISMLIYYLRNRIVHNKAAENHITYLELSSNNTMRDFIKDFMIPCMEIMAFNILFLFPESFKYRDDHLKIELYS